ncbi:MAG: PAS domain-containing protein [Pirellulales bacterium]
MSSQSSLDPAVLGRILLLQSTLQAAPDEQRLLEMIVSELATLPGVIDCEINVEGRVTTLSTPPKKIESERKNWGRIKLRTIRHEFGTIYLNIVNHERFALYLPFVSNTANIVALHIENDRNANELNRLNRSLDELVQEKTEQLSESETRLKQAQKVARIGSFEGKDINGTLWWSDELYRLLGVDPTIFTPTKENFFTLIHPEDRDEYIKSFEDSLQFYTPFHSEFRANQSSGVWRYFETVGKITLNMQDHVSSVRGTVQDITDRKLTEAALNESEEKYRALIEYAPDGILVLDLVAGHFIDFNTSALKLFGITSETSANIGPLDVSPIHQANGILSSDLAKTYISKTMTGKTQIFEWIHLNLNTNQEVECEIRLDKLPSSDRSLARVSIVDISDRKRAEKELSASRELFQLAVEAASLGCYDFDLVDGSLHWDEKMHALFNLNIDSTVDRNAHFDSLLHPEDRERVRAAFASSLEPSNPNTVFRDDFRILLPNGEVRHIESYGIHVKDKQGAVKQVIGACQDITERKVAEELLRESEEKFRSLAENTQDYIMRYDEQGRHLYENPAALEVAGLMEADIIGKTHREAGFDPELCNSWEKISQRYLRPASLPKQSSNGKAIKAQSCSTGDCTLN